MTLDIEKVEQTSHLLGRQKVHDSRSLNFPMAVTVDPSTWRNKAIRIYDPIPNPNQRVGCCTGVAKCVQLNAVGNRKTGRILKLTDAEQCYRENTKIDPWPGVWEPDDTGSSGLASCKSAQLLGWGGEYRWIFGGADEVVQNVMEGRVISVGTWWYQSMFYKDAQNLVKVEGSKAGGHQYVIRGYDADRNWCLGRCWWGTSFKDFWIKHLDLHNLLMDDGDAHFQETL